MTLLSEMYLHESEIASESVQTQSALSDYSCYLEKLHNKTPPKKQLPPRIPCFIHGRPDHNRERPKYWSSIMESESENQVRYLCVFILGQCRMQIVILLWMSLLFALEIEMFWAGLMLSLVNPPKDRGCQIDGVILKSIKNNAQHYGFFFTHSKSITLD